MFAVFFTHGLLTFARQTSVSPATNRVHHPEISNHFAMSGVALSILAVVFAVVGQHYALSNGYTINTLEVFTAIRSKDKTALCLSDSQEAFGPINRVVLGQCLSACQRGSAQSPCVGVNYFDNGVCMLNNNTNLILFTVEPGCIYYTVCIQQPMQIFFELTTPTHKVLKKI